MPMPTSGLKVKETLHGTTRHKFLAVLMRTGGPNSSSRVDSIKKTWARDLEDGALTLLQPNEMCKSKYGDNHWKGLTCLEAKNHLILMNRTDFDWLLVVDDDTYVFPERLREELHKKNGSNAEVYGVAYCGDCGHGRKGFCGGGGYVLSRQSLLKMAGSSDAPVSNEAGRAFVKHFMRGPNSEWCDVRFGCVAQETGLKPVDMQGLYGNGVLGPKGIGTYDKAEERKVVELISQQPPLVIHNVKTHKHMLRLYREAHNLSTVPSQVHENL